MKKKTFAVAALASCMALTATLTGCNLVVTNNKKDMEQVIATVDISNSDKIADLGWTQYKSAITSKNIFKRELVSYFLNYGYSYIQNNGYTYEQTFNTLLDALVNNAVLVQYSTVALIEHKVNDGEALTTVLNNFTDANKTTAEKYEYLLDEDEILLAKYNFYTSINSAIDNYEKTLIDEDDEYVGTATRTTPTNVNTEQDDYYPKTGDGSLDYFIYTGYSNSERSYLLADSGAYQDDAIEGTTRATRVKAYNIFINNLTNNYLIDGDAEADKLTDVLALDYIQSEYVSQLETRIINKYYKIYEEEVEQKLKGENGDYSYIDKYYRELLEDQTESYKSASAFESALSSMSSSSFILYNPDTSDSETIEGVDGNTYGGKFGFVYNILLPFNAKQSARLSELKTILGEDEKDDDYYIERNKLLSQITTVDQREAWFNGATDYSFKADADAVYADGVKGYYGSESGRNYLFFEDNLTDSGEGARYEKLQAYDGRYSYNGNVYENENGSYTLIGNKLDIDGMLAEFSAYINYVLGSNGNVDTTMVNDYYNHDSYTYVNEDGEDDIDYSLFLYAYGSVDLGGFKASDLFNPEARQYKVMSAVNELQFAYTTDTSVLSQYAGYSVSAYDTSYIKEFEYAAKFAVARGEGSFAVCAGDYGWHLIYVTYTFDFGSDGEVYSPVWSNIEVEGTFENLFYEWVKSTHITDIATLRRTRIVTDFNKDTTVTKYQNRYQDLLDLGN